MTTVENALDSRVLDTDDGTQSEDVEEGHDIVSVGAPIEKVMIQKLVNSSLLPNRSMLTLSAE
jgi:hypothetical protein